MSRATVRAAIADYLTAQKANIPHLSQVYKHPPKFTPSGDIYDTGDPGAGTGAVIYLHLARQHERRIAIGGENNGQKLRPYTVGLICVLRSKKRDTEEVGEDNDAFMDGLTEVVEASRTAGAPTVLFQWGEGDTFGGTDVRVRSEMPKPINMQTSQVFSVVEITALEVLNT